MNSVLCPMLETNLKSTLKPKSLGGNVVLQLDTSTVLNMNNCLLYHKTWFNL